jgi:hypothetical protein
MMRRPTLSDVLLLILISAVFIGRVVLYVTAPNAMPLSPYRREKEWPRERMVGMIFATRGGHTNRDPPCILIARLPGHTKRQSAYWNGVQMQGLFQSLKMRRNTPLATYNQECS